MNQSDKQTAESETRQSPSVGREGDNSKAAREWRSAQLQARSTPAVRAALLRLAEERKWSLSWLIHNILAEYVSAPQDAGGGEGIAAAGGGSQGREAG